MAIRRTGTVERLYVRGDIAKPGDGEQPETDDPAAVDGGPGVNIRLAIPPEQAPKAGYFKLLLDHPNYHALYSLALTAAVNRYPLTIRTEEDITSDATAIVNYMVVDW